MTIANTRAYCEMATITTVKSFIVQAQYQKSTKLLLNLAKYAIRGFEGNTRRMRLQENTLVSISPTF
jgi:hypothetical protein